MQGGAQGTQPWLPLGGTSGGGTQPWLACSSGIAAAMPKASRIVDVARCGLGERDGDGRSRIGLAILWIHGDNVMAKGGGKEKRKEKKNERGECVFVQCI